jgi:predicted ATPase
MLTRLRFKNWRSLQNVEINLYDNFTKRPRTLHNGLEAPTISAGTARFVAMLTAFSSLNERLKEEPGLVVIEEPDVSVHPLLFQRLVEMLRQYTAGENPRQVILTTHNPELLNLFEPEEVRIVERNVRGETMVSEVPRQIREEWFSDRKYKVGEVWMTQSLGGIPRSRNGV